jgi:hypothetical protein
VERLNGQLAKAMSDGDHDYRIAATHRNPSWGQRDGGGDDNCLFVDVFFFLC